MDKTAQTELHRLFLVEGLPEPLRPEFLSFPDLTEVERFLGIREEEPAALAA